MRVRVLLLCGLVCTVGCTSAGGHAAHSVRYGMARLSNVDVYPVDNRYCRAFVAVRPVQPYESVLGYITYDNKLEVIEPRPSDLLLSIWTIRQSPDKDKILVLSEGEGGIYLTIFRLSDLLARNRDTPQPARSIAYINMWPSCPSDATWVTGQSLQFQSGLDFSKFDRETRGCRDQEPDLPDTARTWRYDLTTDTFTETRQR